jgi:hypothetical protein
MKNIFIYSILVLFAATSCITIEDDPFVIVDPAVEFRGHLLDDKVVVNSTVYANPAFTNPGNIPTVFVYEGAIDIYNELTGSLLASTPIEGDGLSTVIKTEADAASLDNIIVSASGTVAAYADKESDGDPSNDLFLHKSEFYDVANLSDVINLPDYPIVTMDPLIEYQTYFKGEELYTTATIFSNPTYVNTGSFPILFGYDGVLQIYDGGSGVLLRSISITGSGLTKAVTILSDTTGFDRFVVITSGNITCTGDIGSDGNVGNDILISTAEYYEVFPVDLEE